jgi:chemotaxis protein methyltransferase CheR
VFRVWSAGCASGEEAYSLAIVFEEQFLRDSLHLVATDVSREALAKARAARYGAWSMRNATDEWTTRYFRPVPGKRFELVERVRRQVVFQYLNLARDEYPSFMTGVWGNDIILCRNVLIYLDKETVRAVARRLFDTLADGGWLITGPSDPPLGDYAPYEMVTTDAGVFYRKNIQNAAIVVPLEHSRSATRTAMTTHPVEPNPEPRVESDGERAGSADGASLARARAHFAAGRYEEAIEVVRSIGHHAGAAAIEVRAAANLLGAREAWHRCTAALLRFPLDRELYVLQASLLLDIRDYEGAAEAVRRLLYLDRTLVVGHLLLGSILSKGGHRAAAARAFRNARDLAKSAPADDVVPFTDGEKVGRLTDFARAQIQMLGEPNDARG